MMRPDQLRHTLQTLIDSKMGWYLRFRDHEDGGALEPFVWDVAEQGKFTPFKLIQAEGWMQTLEVAEVLERWLVPERVGSVNGEQWLIPAQDRTGILLNQTTEADRAQVYQEVVDLLQAQLQNLQAFQLSVNSDYALVILVGQTTDQWLCVAPLVPQATTIDAASPIQMASGIPDSTQTATATASEAQVQALLSRLGSIQVYGYYGGGYDQVHAYGLIEASGSSMEQAVEQAISRAGLMRTYRFTGFQPRNDADGWLEQFQQLDRFLQQAFAERWVYRFSFWNDEHFYIVGQDDDGNWGGVVLRSRFTYNP